MDISALMIKELREETGLSIAECRKALEEAQGDKDKAKILLQKKGAEIAAKKSGRTLGSGTVASYIHAGGSVGAMVELSCETDFVARNPEFQSIARDIAMHVAAASPSFLKREDIDDAARERVAETLKAEVADRPADMQEKILAAKIDAYFADKVLLEQEYIKDPSKKIKDLVDAAVQKFGERTELRRFSRFSVSE